jgi:hypothetical protein
MLGWLPTASGSNDSNYEPFQDSGGHSHRHNGCTISMFDLYSVSKVLPVLTTIHAVCSDVLVHL